MTSTKQNNALILGVGECHWGVYSCMYMYNYTEVVFYKCVKLSQYYIYMLDRPSFLSITAEQEQDS